MLSNFKFREMGKSEKALILSFFQVISLTVFSDLFLDYFFENIMNVTFTLKKYCKSLHQKNDLFNFDIWDTFHMINDLEILIFQFFSNFLFLMTPKNWELVQLSSLIRFLIKSSWSFAHDSLTTDNQTTFHFISYILLALHTIFHFSLHTPTWAGIW